MSLYFGGCPVQSVSGRQYDVSVSHSLENHDNDYYQAAIDTAMQVHLNEAPGDILLFLTGQGEIMKVGCPCNSQLNPSSPPMLHHNAFGLIMQRSLALGSLCRSSGLMFSQGK